MLSQRVVRSDDEGASQALDRALAAASELWRTGTFFPRLADAKGREPNACRYCGVSEACRRGGSPARAALQDFAEREGPPNSPVEAALRLGFQAGDR